MRFGSYGGLDASASTRPLAGSIATTAPKPCSRSEDIATCCAAGSMLVTMSSPSWLRPESCSRIEPNSDSLPTSSSLWNFSNSLSPWRTKL